jgi:hypothetical protein
MSHITKRRIMKDIKKLPSKFYITYYARKHESFITRKASPNKPNGVLGKIFTDKNGTDRFIYWDLDKDDWRHATSNWKIKAI